jgi:hypothetical protein
MPFQYLIFQLLPVPAHIGNAPREPVPPPIRNALSEQTILPNRDTWSASVNNSIFDSFKRKTLHREDQQMPMG